MSQELSSLLDRIQKDGVEKAEAQAESILSEARQKAEHIVKEADRAARETREKGQQDAEAFQQRAAKTLEQAARDVILSVTQAIDATFEALVKEKVSATLTPDVLKAMVVEVVKSYAGDREGKTRLEVLLPAETQQQVIDAFMAEFQERMGEGLEIRSDDSVLSGFRVSLVDDQVEHDFSAQAISDALCQLLRPHLAEIVKHASSE